MKNTNEAKSIGRSAAFSNPTRAEEDRIFTRLIKHPGDGCWEFQGAKGPRGYGVVNWRGCTYGAHRLVMIWRRKKDPKDLCVLHHCDNPPCVRPSHLYWGTKKQNSSDAVSRERNVRGTQSHNSKLSVNAVTYIWNSYYAREHSYDGLMAMFAVCRGVIDRIVLKKAWTHITSKLPQPEVFPMPAFKAVGARHGMAVLSADQVPSIRRRLRAGETIASVARDLRVGETTIRNLRNGNTWKHVHDTGN